MSIVGPRPPVTYFPYDGYQNYPDWAKKRFQMRPGITGLAQVKTRTTAPWDERIKIDNEYVEKFNVFFDVKIIFQTLVEEVRPDVVLVHGDTSTTFVTALACFYMQITVFEIYTRDIIKSDNKWSTQNETGKAVDLYKISMLNNFHIV